ncbi:MAG: GNAT family N-acetyltransferase [Cytophagales bacterium]|nr:GNAT family N-acetyltransferase [Armatimonadota bacterium]
MNVTIRAFEEDQDDDYAAAVAIRNVVTPDHPSTVQEMKDGDRRRDPKCHYGRWLAEKEGVAVGYGGYGQSAWAYHPQRFGINIAVLPDQEGRGIGGALHRHLLSALEQFRPTELHTSIREDWERGLRFVQDRGFSEEMREWESRLEVSTFDPSPWAEAREKPARHGILLHSYAELAADPERDRKLHALIVQTFADVPSTIPLTPPSLALYELQVLQHPNFLPDGLMIAVDEKSGAYVGSSEVTRRQTDRDLDTGLTGVLPDYRRKGIALALKLRVIDYAKSLGTPVIRTENATTNRAMLAINEAFGFEKQPVWIQFAHRTPQNEGPHR